MRYGKTLMLIAALLAAALLAGCKATMPDPVSPADDTPERTPEITAVATPVPTEEPTAAPTEEPAPTEPGAEVQFYSPMFEAFFRGKIGKQNGPIYEADVLSVKRLELNDQRLFELRDIALLKNLVDLSLKGTDVEDISFLTELPNLKKLTLMSNDKLKDYSSIANLKGLQYFIVRGQHHPIQDVSIFSDMTELVELDLSSCSAEDITPLAGLTKLKKLIVFDFSADGTGVRDISVVANFPQLEYLMVRGTFDDLTPLAGLTKLEKIVISSRASDLTPLAGLTEMKSLDISCKGITDITPLAGMTKLESLSISGSVSDISVTAGFTELKSLRMGYNKISDISPIAGLTKLTELVLNYNRIKDVSAIAGLTELQDVNLGENLIEDPTPFYGLTKLRFLGLVGNPIPEELRQELREKLPGCGVYFGDGEDDD